MLAFSDQWRRTVLSRCSRSRNNNAAGSSPSGFVRWLGHRSRQFHDFAKSLRRTAKASKLSSSFGKQWTRSDRGRRIELRDRSEMSLSMSLMEKARDESQRWEREAESKTMRKRRWRINGLLTIERAKERKKRNKSGLSLATWTGTRIEVSLCSLIFSLRSNLKIFSSCFCCCATPYLLTRRYLSLFSYDFNKIHRIRERERERERDPPYKWGLVERDRKRVEKYRWSRFVRGSKR